MAKQSINVGTAANDKKGDSLRAAFQKVNTNFTELYTALGINADVTLNLGAFEFAGSVMSTTDSTPIVIDQAVSVTSDLTVGGDIVPNIANGGNLGSLAKPFRSLYVSNNTIYFGNVPLSLDANNNLTVNGSQVSGANTGNFTFDADTITNSNGMTLVTDRGSLVIGTNMEVPGVAGHFHIAIDASNAMPPAGDLFLGDDYNYVKLPGSELNPNAEYGVEIGAHDRDSMDNSHVWRFNTDGGLTFPQGTFLGYSDPGGFIIDGAVDKDIAIYTYSGADAHGWTFGEDGDLTLPEGGDILNSNGDSVLGGGSYTPDDSDNWNDPTVNTVAAALDELAAKVAALENFEIDGGNAYTPAAGELIIDGNGA